MFAIQVKNLGKVYDNDGVWRISPVVTGTATYEIVQATDPDEGYSDHAWLTGDVSWVLYGSAFAK